jgi:hypothetical protein
MRLCTLAAAGLFLSWTSGAAAQEAIRTGDGGAPPPTVGAPPLSGAAPASGGQSPQEIGDWARRVLAGAPAPDAKAPDRPRCAPPPDRKPHGEVWAGIGTHGYRDVGGVVTQPIGDCGSVTVAISHTEANFGRHRR